MGKFKEMDIDRQEMQIPFGWDEIPAGLESEDNIPFRKSADTLLCEMDHELLTALKLLNKALKYSHNPYQDGEPDFDLWQAQVDDFITRHEWRYIMK